ncbi:DNA-binding protein [Streptomyces sp. NPDC088258]|uniref:DNA-binding protein n=1 Tax=Streptomyces sp. NPDC088258 TaxID=3365849 RepID=UPI003816F55A
MITSAAISVEVVHAQMKRPALERTLSRSAIAPVTEEIARRAAALPAAANPHGHRYAIDAVRSSTVLPAPGPVTVLTSEPDDIAALCGTRARWSPRSDPLAHPAPRAAR